MLSPQTPRKHQEATRKTGDSLPAAPPTKQTKRQPDPLSFPASTRIPFDTGQRISSDSAPLSLPTRRLHDQSSTTRSRSAGLAFHGYTTARRTRRRLSR
ncbi:hypothetical protein B0T18DRAFT_244372 [Schizothecium vesticola]|uniref:Uncharacterized protein n=1 Tax=Schizothecium vesticola TaxID=314040 RepID=A0AA40BQ49_9PEZI|nr:hypothetical protein B0T18DRAFT_244372 [Schizothecium vesticola]